MIYYGCRRVMSQAEIQTKLEFRSTGLSVTTIKLISDTPSYPYTSTPLPQILGFNSSVQVVYVGSTSTVTVT